MNPPKKKPRRNGAASPRPGTWRFESNDAWAAWMGDEYLSQLTLEDLDPLPGSAAKKVRFTWWQHNPGRKVPHRVTAHDVRTWELAGEHDGLPISVPPPPPPPVGAGIHIVMDVPGRVTLVCRSIDVRRGRAVVVPVVPHPSRDYMYFVVRSARVVTMGELLAWLALPADAVMLRRGELLDQTELTRPVLPPRIEPIEVVVRGEAWVKLHWMLAPSNSGTVLSVSRASCTDDVWNRVQRLPTHLAPCQVSSAWEFDGSHKEWMAIVEARVTA